MSELTEATPGWDNFHDPTGASREGPELEECFECRGKGERFYVIDGQRIWALCENCGGDGIEP